MDSALLTDLAVAGHGVYSFIRCPGFIGTLIANTLANILITAGTDARLQIQPLNGNKLLVNEEIYQNYTFKIVDIKYG
jgi:hypothetical protein